jgi:hypothetical protein
LINRRLEAKINRLYQNVHTKCNHYGCQTITLSIIYQPAKKTFEPIKTFMHHALKTKAHMRSLTESRPK